MITLKDKTFVKYLNSEIIQNTVHRLANQIYEDYYDKNPLFIGVLNGSFIFLSDLIRKYPGYLSVDFVKLKSYEGLQSSGNVKTILDFPDLIDKDIIIVEDIIDTGHTLKKLYKMINEHQVNSCKVVSLFFKPDAFSEDLTINYIGKNIPDKFIVGYGLDYDGLGRNLNDVYQLKT